MARTRRPNPYIELSGPLFDDGLTPAVKGALAEGIEDLGDEGAGIMMGFITAGGFVNTGGFVRSVDVDLRRDRANSVGWVKLWPTDAWDGAPGRPPRDWMETGRREGVRLRKGIYAFRKTAQRLNAMKYDQFILPRLLAVANGD